MQQTALLLILDGKQNDGRTDMVAILASFFASQRTSDTTCCVLRVAVLCRKGGMGIEHTAEFRQQNLDKKIIDLLLLLLLLSS
jgi:hypothetical protein